MGARPGFPSANPPIPRIVDRFFEFALLGMLASGYFALAGSGYLDWPTATLALVAMSFRGLMAAGVIELRIPNRVTLAIMLLATGFFPLDAWLISRSYFPAVAHLVCVLASLKILTARTNRDFAYLKLVAIVELLAAAILSVSLGFFAFLAMFVLFAIAAFSSGEVRRSAQGRRSVVRGGLRAFPRRLVTISVFLFSGILFMTAALFFVLPRTARAALERFMPQHDHVSGFANGVTLGQIGTLKKSSAPVMHISSQSGDGFLEVRWRGAVQSHFDGRRWTSPQERTQSLSTDHGVLTVNQGRRARPSHAIKYAVKLTDPGADTLFIAGTPQTIRIDVPFVQLTSSESFVIPIQPPTGGLTYAVYSYLEDESSDVYPGPESLSRPQRDALLRLPPIDARIPHLARQMAAGARTDGEKAIAIENHLRRDYGYTLDLLPADVTDPLANFLFDRKKGHCEYFASAMVVLLRTQGIPSRIVTGFQSGVYNPITKLQVVRASDAHAWVEAWIAGRGWTTFDPTPFDPGSTGAGVLSRLSLFFDAAEQFWQDWVVSYDPDRQIALASRMDESARRFRFVGITSWLSDTFDSLKKAGRVGVSYAPAAAAGATLLLGAIFCAPLLVKWWRARVRAQRLARGQGQASDATILYQRMLAMLARRGIQKPPWLTPSEFARVLPASDVSAVVGDLTSSYNALRFGGRGDVAPRMMMLLDQLEKM
jgi:transglutaminase-like putative cysteine protease